MEVHASPERLWESDLRSTPFPEHRRDECPRDDGDSCMGREKDEQ